MYDAADKKPFKVNADTLQSVLIPDFSGMRLVDEVRNAFSVSPNPTSNGELTLRGDLVSGTYVQLYNADLRLLRDEVIQERTSSYELLLPQNKGVYFLVLNTKGHRLLYRLVRI